MKSDEIFLDILYKDDDILIVNKPSGILCISDGYDSSKPYLKAILANSYGKIWVVHRLDKDTSGIILFARSAQAHREMNMQFEKRTVRKTYLALVYGLPCWNEYQVSYPLRKNGDRYHRTIVDFKGGKNALTKISVVHRFAAHTLFAVEIKTGLTHQIRAHLSSLGFPIVGDTLYSLSFHNSPKVSQLNETYLYLHAFSLHFKHPTNQENFYVEAALPAYFQQSLKTLA